MANGLSVIYIGPVQFGLLCGTFICTNAIAHILIFHIAHKSNIDRNHFLAHCPIQFEENLIHFVLAAGKPIYCVSFAAIYMRIENHILQVKYIAGNIAVSQGKKMTEPWVRAACITAYPFSKCICLVHEDWGYATTENMHKCTLFIFFS